MVLVHALHDAVEHVVVVEAAVGLTGQLRTHAPHLGLGRVETKRVVEVVEREFGVAGTGGLEGVLVVLRTHLLAAERKQTFTHAGPEAVDEGGALSAALLDELVLDDVRRDQEDDLAAVDRVVVTAERGPEQRDVAEERHLAVGDGRVLLEEPAEHQGLTVLDLDVRRDLVGELVGHHDRAFDAAGGHRTKLVARDARVELHADRVVLRDERTKHELHTGVEVLHGLRGGRVGRGGREIRHPLSDEDLGPLTVEGHEARTRQHHGVGDGVESADEDRGVAGHQTELHVRLAAGDVAGGGGTTVDRTVGARIDRGRDAGADARGRLDVAADEVLHRTERRDELGDVEVADQGEVDAEGILFGHLDAGDRRVDHDLLRRSVDLGEQFGDAFESIGIVVDHEDRRLRPAVAAHGAEVLLDAAGDLADEAELSAIGEQRRGEFAGVLGGEVFELEHAALGLAIEGLHAGELLLRVDIDELAFLDPAEAVGLEDGVERLVERHVEEVRTDDRRDVAAGDDVPLALQREHLQHLSEVGVLHLDVEGVEVVHLDAGEVEDLIGRIEAARGVLVLCHSRKRHHAGDSERGDETPMSAEIHDSIHG